MIVIVRHYDHFLHSKQVNYTNTTSFIMNSHIVAQCHDWKLFWFGGEI